MANSLNGLDLASRALRSFQRSLDVTGHNISNVGTAGYSRQSANLTTTPPMSIVEGRQMLLGTGVEVSSVTRYRDSFLQSRAAEANSDLGMFDAASQGMLQVQSVFPEPGTTGIADAMGKFFDAWSGLASNPSDTGARQLVQSSGKTLAQRISSTWKSLDTLKSQLTEAFSQTVGDVNQLAQKIENLNQQIQKASLDGSAPNDLLDQRDQALNSLSNLVSVKAVQGSSGRLSVYAGEFALVDDAGAHSMPTQYDASTQKVGVPPAQFAISGGKLAGLGATLLAVNNNQSKLDTLANSLRDEINAVHKTGVNRLGNSGVDYFAPDGVGAAGLRLSDAVSSDARAITAGTTSAASDGAVALELSRMRTQPIAALANRNFEETYRDQIDAVGSDVQVFQSAADTQRAVLSQIDAQRQSISGVSIDDEMANLMRFQRSYQAAAQAFSVFSDVTGELVSMLRR